MAWISSWAQGIVVAIIVATILEMILPEGNNKKYIKMVIGVYILFVIISPVITKVTGSKFNLEEIDIQDYIDTQTAVASANMVTQTNNQNIEQVYLTNIRKEIQNGLQQKGYQAEEVIVEAEVQDEKNYGRLKKVSLTVFPIEEKTESTVQSVNKVEIGTINNQQEQSKEDVPKLSETQRKEIQEYISSTYEIEKDKIQIQN